MLYHLLYPLRDLFFGFNIFKYITFRAAMAAITAFILSVVLGPLIIRYLQKLNLRQTIERAGFSKLYEAHKDKNKVPTMGGILILGAIVLSVCLWADLTNRFVLWTLFTVLWLGWVGYRDDYLKLKEKNSKGLKPRTKLIYQVALGLFLGVYLYLDSPSWHNVDIPFLREGVLRLGALYIFFACAVLVGSSNAVNLTDGLDGLAIGCTAIIALAYGVLSYLTGHLQFSTYLQIPYVYDVGELSVFCAALFGAALGFLWFNSHPASVFMGDVGSLSLGGALGAVALFTKKEILLVIVGGVFVVEALSVILQVTSYKWRKKRIFLMAPIHHHFQLQGITESKVVIRFWIVCIILALFGLATLKVQ